MQNISAKYRLTGKKNPIFSPVESNVLSKKPRPVVSIKHRRGRRE
jgi:hypothetical protein